ncbi:hypothetical protein OAY10_02700 [Acidimicrobiaceae bacterium]|nr:hypothetical protein [Acidimicrobiaceae bacterium]
MTRTNLYLKIILFFLIIFIPFSFSDYRDNITPEKITSDLRFYEINTCSISLSEFLIHNPNVIYQDHYKIRYNNYSSLRCFGQITGVDQIDHTFYISIGTNTFVNIFLQSIFWLFLITLIPVDKFKNLKISNYISILLTSLLICLLIYSEQRFYNNVFFELDFLNKRSLLHIFVYISTINFFSFHIINSRSKELINFLPFLYIFMGVYSGMNIYFLSLFLCLIGINKVINDRKIRKTFNILNLLIIFWSYNASGLFYYLKPDKIRGLSHGDYNFLSVLTWSYFSIFCLIGIYYFISDRKSNLNFKVLTRNFLFASVAIMSIGYLSSSMPFINFMSYYYFGLTKYGTDNQNLFGVDIWGTTEAWRGLFPSAESIGEFFALGLLVIFLYKKEKLEKIEYLLIPVSILGLLLSNNKASFVLLIFCIVLKLNFEKNFKTQTKILVFIPVIFLLLYFIRIENLFYSLDFSAYKFIGMGQSYSLDSNISSSIQYLSDLSNKNFIIRFLIVAFGLVAFLINRSELWGIFFARYNPTVSEFFFGSGPFILSNHYGEIDIFNKRVFTGTELGFLLPHSSLLLIQLFFGLTGVIILTVYVVNSLKKIKSVNYDLYLIGIFISINLIKSDSLLYLPSLLLYGMFFVLINNKEHINLKK